MMRPAWESLPIATARVTRDYESKPELTCVEPGPGRCGRARLRRRLRRGLAVAREGRNAMSARTSRCRVGYRVSRAAIRYTARNAWGISGLENAGTEANARNRSHRVPASRRIGLAYATRLNTSELRFNRLNVTGAAGASHSAQAHRHLSAEVQGYRSSPGRLPQARTRCCSSSLSSSF